MSAIRYILLLVFVLAINNLTRSQSFHGGISAGLVGSQVAGDNYSGFHKAGIFAGGYVGWDFTKRSSLYLELQYFQKGSRESPTEENNYDSYLFRCNYIELPVLYHFRINWFSIFAGPSGGFLMGYYEESNGFVISDEDGYNTPARATLQITAGFRFLFKGKFGFDFRTNNSLLNIRTENRGRDEPGAPKDVWRLWGYGQFHDSLVLSLFYQFR